MLTIYQYLKSYRMVKDTNTGLHCCAFRNERYSVCVCPPPLCPFFPLTVCMIREDIQLQETYCAHYLLLQASTKLCLLFITNVPETLVLRETRIALTCFREVMTCMFVRGSPVFYETPSFFGGDVYPTFTCREGMHRMDLCDLVGMTMKWLSIHASAIDVPPLLSGATGLKRSAPYTPPPEG